MAVDYHLRYFLIAFFICIGAAIVFVLPLAIVSLLNIIKKNGCKATGALSIVVSLFTSIAVILFALGLMVLAIFSWVPWWASGILITVFIVLVVAALKPWRKTEWGFTLWFMIALLILVIALGWVGSWLSHDVCFTSQPSSYTFYIDRYNAGDPCAKSGNKPCHTYLTLNVNASTDVIVHFHSTKLYQNARVHYGSIGPGVYTSIITASSHKIDIDADRYVYYGFLRGLTPNTTYWFTAGDGTTVTGDTFIEEKKFRTAPASGDFNFITGGDIGANPASATLMRMAASTEPVYMAIGGDLAYANGIRACYPRWDAFLTNLEANAITPSGYTVPFVMAPGNHEAAGWAQPAKNMRFYNRYFVHEDLNGRLAKDLPLHHVHYISNQVLVSLDSHVIETPESQVDWLAQKLSSAPAGSFKTAMYHAPGYPSYREFTNPESVGVRTYFVPVFEQHGLTAGFENHDHAYKRTKLLIAGQENPAGILYIGDGAMGVKARAGVTTAGKDYLQTAASKQFFIVAQTNNTGGNIRFTAYDIDNAAFDDFVMNYRS